MIEEYYNRRAPEYDQVYNRPDPLQQSELARIATELPRLFAGRRVLEIACGTGYWTRLIAPVAETILAMDASPNMLALARDKLIEPVSVDQAQPQQLSGQRRLRNRPNVQFLEADAYSLQSIPGRFDAGLANFWLSHVPKTRSAEFFDGLHARLDPGALVFMADNIFDPTLGGDFLPAAAPGHDSHRIRQLADGSTWRVVKNYFDPQQLLDLFEPRSTDLHIEFYECFWWLHYTVR